MGTALTNTAGHYGFSQVLPGNYMLRAVRTTSVNYPAQSFSASYATNELANAGVALTDAGDETVAGAYTTNLLLRDYETVVFTDKTADFGFTGTFTAYVRNVSGNVFNDPDGGNVNHSSNTANAVPANMYANIFNANNGIVEDTVLVNTNGTYTFANIPEDDYKIQISTTKGIIGTVIPSFPTPSAYAVSWATTGHFNGAENMGKDGPGVVSNMFKVESIDITNINFGIQRTPIPTFTLQPTIPNPGGIGTYVFPSTAFSIGTQGYAGVPPVASGANLALYNTQDYDGGTVTRIMIDPIIGGSFAIAQKVNSITINGIQYRVSNPTSFATCPTCPLFNTPKFVNYANGDVAQPIIIDPIDGNDTVRVYYFALDNLGNMSQMVGIARVDFFETVVPIKIERFTAIAKENDVHINWWLTNETNITKYEVEHSTNGINFSNVSSIVTNNASNYAALHSKPNNGVNYYRLKIIEADGKITYSDIKKVLFSSVVAINIYPNPTKNILNIELSASMLNKNCTIQIIAMDGKIQSTKKINFTSQIEVVNVNMLANGKYVLQIKTNEELINKSFEIIR